MKRRAWALLGWTSAFFAIAALAAAPARAIELRGRTGTRATHRLAALQVDDFEETVEPSPSDAEVQEMPAEEMPPPPPVRKPSKPAPKAMKPIPAPAWDADVIHPHPMSHEMQGPGDMHGPRGGLCSDGYCEECPTYGGCWNVCGSWGSLEYLLWWRDGRKTPVLITTSTTATDVDLDGELGRANTRILLGESQFDDHLQPGGRLDLGFWLDGCHSFGLGARVTALGDDDLNFVTSSATNPVLTVPFFNLDPAVNAEDTLVVASPLDVSTGFIRVTGHNEVYLGDIYARVCGVKSDRYRIDLLGGYGFSRINEDLTLLTSTTTGGNTVVVRDRFRTKNEYHGLLVGLLGEFDRGSWKVNASARATLANVTQTSIIDGLTTINGTPDALTGLFVQASNRGRRETEEFAVIPEVGVNWVYKIGCGADLTVGYTAVYWSEALRPGEQINRRVDPTQTTRRPAPEFVSGEYWAQGFNFGLGWSY